MGYSNQYNNYNHTCIHNHACYKGNYVMVKLIITLSLYIAWLYTLVIYTSLCT